MSTIELASSFPEVVDAIDPSAELSTSAEIIVDAGEEYLVVTQIGEDEGGKFKFLMRGGKAVLSETNNVLEAEAALIESESLHANLICEKSSSKDHKDVYAYAQEVVGKFSSEEGPDGGNLACVWAVRNLVHKVLGRWVTRTDGTAVFTSQLQKCFINSFSEEQISEGGIIISPTQGRNIGHVGILGPSTTVSSRLIYSNSSKRKVWSQNRTLDSWCDYYSAEKNLPVLFFPLPYSHS